MTHKRKLIYTIIGASILCFVLLLYVFYKEIISKEMFQDVCTEWYEMPKYIPRKNQSQTTQNVSRVIFQTNEKFVLSGMKKAIYTWVSLNPDYDYRYYTTDDCRDFIQKNFDKDVIKAYDMLIPGAYKADLWRYCVLYKYGGVYVDSSMVCEIPLTEYVEKDDTFITAIDNGVKGGIYNAFICSAPQHPILYNAIKISVTRILGKEYVDSLYPTGPIAFGDAINEFFGRNHNSPFDKIMNENGIKLFMRSNFGALSGDIQKTPIRHAIGRIYDLSNREIVLTKYDGYATEKSVWSKIPSYGDLWNKHQIYTDNTPLCTNSLDISLLSNQTQYSEISKDKTIEPIIHFMWLDKEKEDNEDVPDKYKKYVEGWKNKNPSYTVKLWNRKTVKELLSSKVEYKDYLNFWLNTINRHIEKCDFARDVILYEKGGLYVDLDMECLKPVESLLTDNELVFVMEPQEHRDKLDTAPLRISNGFMASKSKEPFWPYFMDSIVKNYDKNKNVLQNTGPVALSQALYDYFEIPERRGTIPEGRKTIPEGRKTIPEGIRVIGSSKSSLMIYNCCIVFPTNAQGLPSIKDFFNLPKKRQNIDDSRLCKMSDGYVISHWKEGTNWANDAGLHSSENQASSSGSKPAKHFTSFNFIFWICVVSGLIFIAFILFLFRKKIFRKVKF